MSLKIKANEIQRLFAADPILTEARIDLYSTENKILQPSKISNIKTGLQIDLPPEAVGLIWDRPGSFSSGETLVLGGVFDFRYKGEIFVNMLNLSQKQVRIQKGDHIAQLIIQQQPGESKMICLDSETQDKVIPEKIFSPEQILP